MKVFILYSHPEPQESYNGALLRQSVNTLEAQGHEVLVSDLYAMGFNPVASAEDFMKRRFPDRLQYDREQKYSAQHQSLRDDIVAEMEKVQWCDLFIVQFPLYWFSMPAIMKGWFDRVFVNSIIYGAGKRYENGGLKGRKAMVCMTTGGFAPMFEPDGLLGDMDVTLWHIHNGILGYTGFEVLPPFVAWSPAHYDQEVCDRYLAEYAELLRNVDSVEPMPFHRLTDFDSNFRLKEGIEPRTAAHRRVRTSSQSN